jgi:hypothetical protein
VKTPMSSKVTIINKVHSVVFNTSIGHYQDVVFDLEEKAKVSVPEVVIKVLDVHNETVKDVVGDEL